jgi:hypothetical protein
MADEHLAASDIADYWTPDVAADTVERIEAHVFRCAECSNRLTATRELIDGVRDAARQGRVQAIITDAVLNQMARDGTRIRMFTLDPGAVVPCAVWAGDQVIVSRLRGDFSGLDRVSLVMEVGGEEVDRVTDLPVGAGGRELLQAFSADHLRQLPRVEVRLRLFGSRGPAGDALVAEYVLEHAGALERPQRANLP